MVFKRESVTERLKRLEEVLAKLRERAGITFEEFRGDTDAQWIIERGLEIASSAILDIGNHILAGAYQTSVEEYEQILEKLQEKRVISGDLYRELRMMAGKKAFQHRRCAEGGVLLPHPVRDPARGNGVGGDSGGWMEYPSRL